MWCHASLHCCLTSAVASPPPAFTDRPSVSSLGVCAPRACWNFSGDRWTPTKALSSAVSVSPLLGGSRTTADGLEAVHGPPRVPSDRGQASDYPTRRQARPPWVPWSTALVTEPKPHGATVKSSAHGAVRGQHVQAAFLSLDGTGPHSTPPPWSRLPRGRVRPWANAELLLGEGRVAGGLTQPLADAAAPRRFPDTAEPGSAASAPKGEPSGQRKAGFVFRA